MPVADISSEHKEPSNRPALSRDRIAAKALELIDANGLAGMSMRKLGAELGVEAMSLYHYVNNKDDLLDAVLDLLYQEIKLPDVGEHEWEIAIREGLGAFHDVLIAHPAALELFSSRPATSDAAFGVMYWAHQRFMAVGLSIEDAHNALHLAVSFVMGHAASELGALKQVRNGNDDLPEHGTPELIAFFEHSRSISAEDMFAAGLEVVVAGLRACYDLP